MEPNLSFPEIIIWYLIMMIIVIAAGFMQNMYLVILSVAVFITAISGWCPVYQLLGRGHVYKNDRETYHELNSLPPGKLSETEPPENSRITGLSEISSCEISFPEPEEKQPSSHQSAA